MMRRGPGVEVWGGLEATINRVGDRYFHQLRPDGRGHRRVDLERVAALGIRTLRFPVLWEQFAPDARGRVDWSWADERLEWLRELGITPIVGLVHHGSGPPGTSLVDPAFPARLADYARAVAARYPWVEAFTPVNEPLTTARFSGLYGYWYPHGRDAATFVRALRGQVRAIGLAMRAIREVTPGARLVQTEDLGEVFSTPALAYQAEFENERRWLSLDLLCGQVTAGHRMWGYLRDAGMTEAERATLAAEPCPPDVFGINHYITSDRYLDEDLARHPPECHGGNERQAYADTEAVRARPDGVPWPDELLRRAWERYGIPLAVTEAHLACTPEEQVRWFMEIWNAAGRVAAEGVDLRAVTAWSLFGAYDWDSLLTKSRGHYEPGVFDLQCEPPRATALAPMLARLARGEEYRDPLLAAPGWWRRPSRLRAEMVSREEGSTG